MGPTIIGYLMMIMKPVLDLLILNLKDHKQLLMAVAIMTMIQAALMMRMMIVHQVQEEKLLFHQLIQKDLMIFNIFPKLM